ncbi:MAG: Gfo/Idh/MocA family oxidoreductase [Acidimicrobiia bacterium]|nr:Gfo/Idh/MocA family oxidoreductase [Acidimicrobiia bacterium]
MTDLKFAVMGAGFWSRYQIPAWFEVGGVELVAVYNRTVSKAETTAERFDVPKFYGDAEELFRNEDLDFVDIITEVGGHAPLVKLAAKYRVPVICQKPMAGDLETAQAMVDVCEAAGIPFFIHENFRYQTPIRRFKELLSEGTIGDPFRARIQFIHGFPVFENQPFLRTLEKFILTDLGTHILDIARFLFGEPHSLYCQHLRSRDDIAGEDVASVLLRFEDVICYCEMSQSSKTEWGRFPETFIYVEGTQGTLELGPDFWIRSTTGDGTLSRRYPPPRYDWADPDYDVAHASMVPIQEAFVEALRSGVPPETTGKDNLKTLRLVFQSYESAEQNAVIDLTQ